MTRGTRDALPGSPWACASSVRAAPVLTMLTGTARSSADRTSIAASKEV